MTQVSKEEKSFRDRLFVVPDGEMVDVEVKKTKRTVAAFMVFGLISAVALITLWVIPYYRAL